MIWLKNNLINGEIGLGPQLQRVITNTEMLSTSTGKFIQMGLNGQKFVEANDDARIVVEEMAHAIRCCVSTEAKENS